MTINKKDFIQNYGGNGLMFSTNGDERPRIQDLDDCIQIYTDDSSFSINKDQIDDVVKLLISARITGYKINE